MQILPEFLYAYILDEVTGPVVPKFSWCYDAAQNDFMLKPLVMLEETTGPTVKVRINGTELYLPAAWNLLIADDETKDVDTVPITQCSNSSYKAYMMHPSLNRYELAEVQLLDLDVSGVVVHPSIPRQCLICHPVGPTIMSKDLPMCVLVGPQDVGKLMNNYSAQELLI